MKKDITIDDNRSTLLMIGETKIVWWTETTGGTWKTRRVIFTGKTDTVTHL